MTEAFLFVFVAGVLVVAYRIHVRTRSKLTIDQCCNVIEWTRFQRAVQKRSMRAVEPPRATADKPSQRG